MLSEKLSVILSIKQPAKASSYKNRIGFLSRFLENQLCQLQYLVDALKDYPVLIPYLSVSTSQVFAGGKFGLDDTI